MAGIIGEKQRKAWRAWYENLSPEQLAELNRKRIEGKKRSLALAKAQTSSNDVAPADGGRQFGLTIQERVNGKYIQGSSRSFHIVGAPFTGEELYNRIDLFLSRLKGQFRGKKEDPVSIHSTKVVRFGD